jgi:hypothetical protein
VSEKNTKGTTMNSKIIQMILALFLVATINASADNHALSFETISKDASLHKNHKKLEIFDPGYHKTIIRISELTEHESYVLKWHRPLLDKKDHSQECSKNLFLNISKHLGEDGTAFVMTSKGFLPGEKITLSIETKAGTKIGQPLEFFPQPLIQEMRSGKSKLIAELSAVSPSRYEITFEGISSFETLVINSFSSGEKLVNEFQYRQGSCIGLTPGVIGKEGGSCELSIKRQHGDKFRVNLPWGKELSKHLSGESPPVAPHFTTITGKSKELK